MAVGVYKGKVSQKRLFNRRFCLVHVELLEPSRFEFEAGQYVLFSVSGVGQKKNYSVASPPQMSHAIEILVDISPGGEGSSYLGGLEAGDEVEFLGPVGEFTVKGREEEGGVEEERVVMVATGSGISPLRSMILDLLEARSDTREVRLYWGLRNEEDMFWEEDFYQLAKEFENFSFEIILSKPSNEWKLSRGYVTDLVAIYEKDKGRSGYYLCGNGGMIEDVRRVLGERGVEGELIHTEKFY